MGGDEPWRIANEAHASLVERFPNESAAMLMSMKMLISASRTAEEAADIIERTFTDFVLPVADNPSVHLVEISDTLSYRYAVARTLLAAKDSRSAEDVQGKRLISRSSRGLFPDTTLGFDAYFSCMCASLSPAIWAYPIGRPGAVILLLFGDAMSGQETLARDKIQLLAPQKRSSEVDLSPTSDPKTYTLAARWWVEQLSTLFSIVTEPANYAVEGFFEPAKATERLLTIEQIFRDCQSILTLTRDDHARTMLAFTLLKRLEGVIPGYSWKSVVGHTAVATILEKLKLDVPKALHDVFLRRAERAVRAIESLEDGFFAGGDNNESSVLLPDKNGVVIPVSRKAAVTEWLQLYRDSLHGFGKPSRRDRALLAAHDGEMPGDFADVAWLHVLDVVAHPEKLAAYERLQRIEASRGNQRGRQTASSNLQKGA